MSYYKILMNLHRKSTAISRPFALPLHSSTSKQTQSIGWELVASTNCTERFLVGFGFNLRRQWRLGGLDGLVPMLKFG